MYYILSRHGSSFLREPKAEVRHSLNGHFRTSISAVNKWWSPRKKCVAYVMGENVGPMSRLSRRTITKLGLPRIYLYKLCIFLAPLSLLSKNLSRRATSTQPRSRFWFFRCWYIQRLRICSSRPRRYHSSAPREKVGPKAQCSYSAKQQLQKLVDTRLFFLAPPTAACICLSLPCGALVARA